MYNYVYIYTRISTNKSVLYSFWWMASKRWCRVIWQMASVQRHLADLPALISCTFLEVSRPCSTRVWVKFSSPGKDSCCSFSVLKYPSMFLSFSKANVLQCGCFNHPILGVNKVQFWFVKPNICWLNGQFFVALTIPSFGFNQILTHIHFSPSMVSRIFLLTSVPGQIELVDTETRCLRRARGRLSSQVERWFKATPTAFLGQIWSL